MYWINRPGLTYCFVAVIALLATDARAQLRSFTGDGDGTSWTNADNWTDNDVPDSISEDSSIDLGGSWDVTYSGPTINIGELTVGSDDSLTLNNRINASSVGTMSGEITINPGGYLDIENSWTNNGTITINESGPINTQGVLTNNGLIQGASFFLPLGVLATNVVNNGTIAPGFGENDFNGVGFASNLTLASTSVLDIEIGGGTTAFSFDYISVALDLFLGGELQLTQLNGYEPDPSISLTIIDVTTSDGTSGSFSNIASGERLTTTDGAGSWLVTYGTSDVVISDYQPIPEPASLAMMVMGCLLLARRQRI